MNHCISKQIVNSDFTVFALEDLSKIRVQKRRGKQFNRKLNNWSFYQLEQFIRYKAESVGKFQLHADLNAARNIAQACMSSLGRLPCQPAECSVST
ncbi:MAG: IS200/IS605 family accessory protein TnpB-related protein [Methanotrichaceae archaeon]